PAVAAHRPDHAVVRPGRRDRVRRRGRPRGPPRGERHRLDPVVASSRAVGVVEALARPGLVAPRPRTARGLAVTKRTRTSPDKNARWVGLGINSALARR